MGSRPTSIREMREAAEQEANSLIAMAEQEAQSANVSRHNSVTMVAPVHPAIRKSSPMRFMPSDRTANETMTNMSANASLSVPVSVPMQPAGARYSRVFSAENAADIDVTQSEKLGSTHDNKEQL